MNKRPICFPLGGLVGKAASSDFTLGLLKTAGDRILSIACIEKADSQMLAGVGDGLIGFAVPLQVGGAAIYSWSI